MKRKDDFYCFYFDTTLQRRLGRGSYIFFTFLLQLDNAEYTLSYTSIHGYSKSLMILTKFPTRLETNFRFVRIVRLHIYVYFSLENYAEAWWNINNIIVLRILKVKKKKTPARRTDRIWFYDGHNCVIRGKIKIFFFKHFLSVKIIALRTKK